MIRSMMGARLGRRAWRARAAVAALALLLLAVAPLRSQPASAATTTPWPTYLGNNAHTNYNASETAITAATAPNLKPQWQKNLDGSTISTQPIVANGLIYVGTWNGYERALDPNGNQVWATYLGRTLDSTDGCQPPEAGVASTSSYQASMTIGGTSHAVLFVGGGGNLDASGNTVATPQAALYALDATTGAILWQTPLGSAPSHFLWSSPAYYNGSLYEGVASFGDCPLVQGQVVKLDAVTGAVQATFNTVPNGCAGGGVWGSPAVDEAQGTVYVNTGNAEGCPLGPSNYAESIVELRAADLTVVGSWAIPTSHRIADGDFGSAVTLFSAKIRGHVQSAAGVQNKNGQYYAFQRDNLGAGPIWQKTMGNGGDCPQCGTGGIAPSAYDGTNLYVASGQLTTSTSSCQGTLQALRTNNGSTIWQICLSTGAVLAAVTAAPGIVVAETFGGTSGTLYVVNAATGAVLFTYTSNFYAASTIDNGTLYVGDVAGTLSAFAP